MPTTERLTAADGPQGDDWATAPTAPALPPETQEQRTERQRHAQDRLGHAIFTITAGVKALNEDLASAMEQHTDDLEHDALAETVAWLQDVRRSLGEAESYVARELGRMDSTPEIITLPDGRVAQVMKGKDRKEWRHDDWKRDVINAVVPEAELVAYVVDAETGESRDVDVADLIAKAQAVHGSAAPKVTALKALGLAADDYCTTGPGPYSVKISAPSTPTQEG